MKPAHEPIVVARKPLIGTVAQTVSEFGTGALNIDGCRIEIGDEQNGFRSGDYSSTNTSRSSWEHRDEGEPYRKDQHPKGRWPANVALSHLPECERVGERRVKPIGSTPKTDSRAGLFGVKGREGTPNYTDADGLETVGDWDCQEGCPILELDRQSGERPSGGKSGGKRDQWTAAGRRGESIATPSPRLPDAGSASRFFATFKGDCDHKWVLVEHTNEGPVYLCQLCGASTNKPGAHYADPDGLETVAEWDCAEGCPVRELDAQSGERPGFSGGGPQAGTEKFPGVYGDGLMGGENNYYGDTGGASRFFATFQGEGSVTPSVDDVEGVQAEGRADPSKPCLIHGIRNCTICSFPRFRYVAKASRAERNAGLEGFEERQAQKWNEGGIKARRLETAVPVANVHPTVKPVDLMRWLVRLVTPPGGRVLDCFVGSGTTGIAAVLEGFDFIGIEREAEYVEIAKARIAWWEQHKGRDTDEVLAVTRKSEAEREKHDLAGQMGLDV